MAHLVLGLCDIAQSEAVLCREDTCPLGHQLVSHKPPNNWEMVTILVTFRLEPAT